MGSKIKRIVGLFIAVCVMAVFPVIASTAGEYDDTTVVIFVSNLRGNVDALPLIAAARNYFEESGADVILASTGNFLQGTRYSSFNSGSTIITLMIQAGFDVVALGPYDFAFGTGTLGTAFHGDAVEFGPLGVLLEANPSLRAVSANINGQNEFFHGFTANTVITTESGLDIAFFGLTDPSTAQTVLESNLTGLRFTDPIAAESEQRAELEEYDFVFGMSNVAAPSGMDVGAIVIDNSTLEYRIMRIDLNDFTPQIDVLTSVNEFRVVVDNMFPQVFRSEVTLDGSIAANRSGETDLGNFWADALRWFAISGEINAFFGEDDIAIGNDRIQVEAENVVALWNAGNLRDFLYTGDVTVQDLRRVLPFPNTVAVVYLTGAELLEQLEASAQGLPFSDETFMLAASFMHVSGIEYSIDASRVFDAGEAYRDRIWHVAESVNRVTIHSVNGNPFDETAVYAVITSNANFNGMDISYVLAARESDVGNLSTVTTARVVDHAVMMYIASLPNATITADYVAVEGRITVTGYLTRGSFVAMLHRFAGSPLATELSWFEDVPEGHRYSEAIAWAAERGITNGVSATEFALYGNLTQQQMAVLLYRYNGTVIEVLVPSAYVTFADGASVLERIR